MGSCKHNREKVEKNRVFHVYLDKSVKKAGRGIVEKIVPALRVLSDELLDHEKLVDNRLTIKYRLLYNVVVYGK